MIRKRYLIGAAALSLLAACGEKQSASDAASVDSAEAGVSEDTIAPAEAARTSPTSRWTARC